MKKLIKSIKWIDNNLLKIFLSIFVFFIPLWFKFPFIDIEFTYISIRLDDILIVLLYAIFIIQVLRKKIKPRFKFAVPIIFFWISVSLSFILAHFVFHTVPIFSIGFYHTLRRIEYMFVFFIAMASIDSKDAFIYYLKLYITALLLVCIYGICQRFLNFPAVQTMNPEYARGRILSLTPEARISSTFGGHYDLSAYLVMSIPLLLGYYLYLNKKYLFVYLILAITTLIYTAQRISFVSYAVVITAYLLIIKRFKLYLIIFLLTTGLIFLTGDLAKRFSQTLQFKSIFINTETGGVTIKQEITAKELPAGNLEISSKLKKDVNLDEKLRKEILAEAQRQAVEEAQAKGITNDSPEFNNRVNQIASLIDVKRTVLCDISCSTRLQVEWPRAIVAFTYNPIFGTGPSSLTEATDNDYLRWLGEFGAIGLILFLYILFGILIFLIRHLKKMTEKDRLLYLGFIFGFIGLLINATYIDVFEASKVAYNFWFLSGIFVGNLLNKETAK